jgi:peptidyl-prolyl cis-trans isomerase D
LKCKGRPGKLKSCIEAGLIGFPQFVGNFIYAIFAILFNRVNRYTSNNMSIIQQIREKAAWLVFGVIGLSLIGFLLMDAFVGGSGQGMFSGNSTVVGSVNGEKVNYLDFERKRRQVEEQYKASGYPVNEMMQQNIQDQVWNQYIEDNVLQEEYNTLGLEVSAKELNDMLFGNNPPQELKQQFTNQETGAYDANAARSAIDNLRKQKDNPSAMQFEEAYLPSLVNNRLKEKYSSLLANTAYVPKWMLEKINSDNNSIASISYVNVAYASIADSTIRVSDDDINAYITKNKDDYKQPLSRSISYVSFNAAPSSSDSLALHNQMLQLRDELRTTQDVAAFLVRNGSEVPFFEGYVLKSKLQVPNADSITALADGEVFGPYIDGQNEVIAKMIDRKTLPDSVKVRHILINTQNGLPDSTGKARIDSIASAIKGGADFSMLSMQYSDDPGSKTKGGEYEFGSQQFTSLAKEFAEASFYGRAGDKKVIKTTFGYHYIEVLSQRNFEPAFRIAYLSKPITASQETLNSASGMANQFAGESRTAKDFDANISKNKYNKLLANEVKPVDNMIPGLGSSRQLVRWIFEADKGDVSEPYDLGDKFVVAMVTEINKEGVMSASKARPQVEFIVRNQKKAEQIIKKINNANTLQAVATATGSTVQKADSISFASPVIPNVGQEPKVVGATFNKQWLGKVTPPIAGNGGVFVITPANVSAKPNLESNLDQQRLSMQMQMKSMSGYRSLEALKKSADVTDNRAKFL